MILRCLPLSIAYQQAFNVSYWNLTKRVLNVCPRTGHLLIHFVPLDIQQLYITP